MMRIRRQRGFGLLLAMVALSVVSTIGVGALIRARHAATTARFSVDEAQARLLVSGVEKAVVAWAETMARDPALVVFPDSGFHEILQADREDVRVRVDAIDLSGRLHIAHLETFAQRGLPTSLQSIDIPAARQLLSDLERRQLTPTLEQVAALPGAGAGEHVSVYPQSIESGVNPAVCQWITTRGTGALNIHSAPVDLLKAALSGLNPTLTRKAVAARSRGERIEDSVASSLITERNRGLTRSGRASRHVPLTTTSGAYGFLMSIEQSGRVSRWWMVGELTPQQNRTRSSPWTIVERRSIAP